MERYQVSNFKIYDPSKCELPLGFIDAIKVNPPQDYKYIRVSFSQVRCFSSISIGLLIFECGNVYADCTFANYQFINCPSADNRRIVNSNFSMFDKDVWTKFQSHSRYVKSNIEQLRECTKEYYGVGWESNKQVSSLFLAQRTFIEYCCIKNFVEKRLAAHHEFVI